MKGDDFMFQQVTTSIKPSEISILSSSEDKKQIAIKYAMRFDIKAVTDTETNSTAYQYWELTDSMTLPIEAKGSVVDILKKIYYEKQYDISSLIKAQAITLPKDISL